MSVGYSTQTTGTTSKPFIGSEQERLEKLDRIGFPEDDEQPIPPHTIAEQKQILADFDTLIASIDFTSPKTAPQPVQQPGRSAEEQKQVLAEADALLNRIDQELGEQPAGKEITISREDNDRVLQELSGAAGKAGETILSVAETIGKAAPGVAKDIFTEGLDLLSKVSGIDLLQKSPAPANKEAQDPKKLEEAAQKRQSLAVIERERARVPEERYAEMVKACFRLGVSVEKIADMIDAPHLKKEALLTVYYIALGDNRQTAEKKAQEKVSKNQSFAEIKAQSRNASGDVNLSTEQGTASRYNTAG